MDTPNYQRTKTVTYLVCASTAICSCLSPLLFTIFNKTYGISYTLLGFLVVLNFGTQLLVDLIYSFFSYKINLKWSVRLIPLVMGLGFALYALSPLLFPSNVYVGLALGTVLFSAGAGLGEVLTSPLIAAIPSPNPERQMSRLHSCYAWGVVIVVAIAALWLRFLGSDSWQWLTAVFAAFPLVCFVFFLASPIPNLQTEKREKQEKRRGEGKTAVFFVLCIFFAGATELTMNQWGSGYLETTFAMDKTLCDLLGLGLFGASLAVGRTLYAKIGKNIHRVLFFGSLGAVVCYAVAALSNLPALGLVACAATGFFVSMLWPGSLIAVTERIPHAGVGLFALMAVGGDLGATFYPQAVGAITDAVMANEALVSFGAGLGLTAEQTGMRAGMVVAILAPLLATILFGIAWRSHHRYRKAEAESMAESE